MFTKPEDSAAVDMDALAEQLNSLVADFTEDGKLDFSLSVLENLPRKQGNVQNSKRNTHRADIKSGMTVDIVLKKDQPTGKLTRGVVGRILTNSADHHRGIKHELKTQRGRRGSGRIPFVWRMNPLRT